MTSEENISRHAVTEPKKCQEMADKYGWVLLRVEPTNSKILEFICVFEGDTEFPDYTEKKHNE